jgi:hypothetical protein
MEILPFKWNQNFALGQLGLELKHILQAVPCQKLLQ